MKKALFIHLLSCCLLVHVLNAQEVKTASPVSRASYDVSQIQYSSDCDELCSEIAPITIDSPHVARLVFDLGNQYAESEVGALLLTAKIQYGVELTVCTSDGKDYNQNWVIEHLTGNAEGRSRTYQLPFKTQHLKGAQFVTVNRFYNDKYGEPNGVDKAEIDCLEFTVATTQSVQTNSATAENLDWMDEIGRLAFRGSQNQLFNSRLHGIFISRVSKVFLP